MAAGELCFMTASVVGCECRNCEDIAMSFLVANATSAPPLWVKGNLLLCSYLQFTFHFGICCFAPIFSVLSILAFVKLLVLWLWVLCDKTVQIDHVLFDDTACPCWCDFFGSTQVDYLRSGQQVSAACKATLSIALNVWTTLCLYMGICPL